MRVLVTASFKAPFGGLQANVRAQLRAIRQAESTPVLACDAGRFAEAVRSEGFEVIDGDLLSAEVHRRCVGAGPFDLIHAHPFAARQLGLAVATELGLPMLVTLHGNYTDSLSEYHSAINYVVVVSRAIRDRLLATIDIAPEKVLVIPNGTDTDLFSRRQLRPAIEMRRNPSTAASFLPAGSITTRHSSSISSSRHGTFRQPSVPSTSGGWSPAMVPTSRAFTTLPRPSRALPKRPWSNSWAGNPKRP